MTIVNDAPLAEIDPRTLYQILALRSAVFVVEQDCAYLDPDGRDLEPDARQLWVERDGSVVATLRLLAEPGDDVRIGRVVTAPTARGDGLAAVLMNRAIELAGPAGIVLDAQEQLTGWYARFGFETTGPRFTEDNIWHVPMRRRPSAVVRPATADDLEWIIALIDRNRADSLGADERARSGFVQGHWDVATLRDLLTGPGMFVATVADRPAGVALATSPGAVADGPAGRTNELAVERFGPDGYFLYGPVVVEAAFRGRGVLRRLADRLCEHAATRYPNAVAFVETSNTHSLAVHQHLGWQEFASFRLGDRQFSALARPLG